MSTIEVNRDALYAVLVALNGPAHHVRELQYTRGIAALTANPNPIDVLIADFKRGVDKAPQTTAAADVLAERRRQIGVEGWTPEHDDEHGKAEMADAAACYAANAGVFRDVSGAWIPAEWPWAPEWWKPTTPRQDLVKAAALILAEIERLDRKAARESLPDCGEAGHDEGCCGTKGCLPGSRA